MNKEELQFQNRMMELAHTAWQREIPVFTNFLQRNELHILHSIRTFPDGIRLETFGGYEFAERQMAVFLPDAPFLQYTYPFEAIRVMPRSVKYAESLGHRDYLGAILNLGIDRGQLGDLIVQEDGCIVFCTPQIASFLESECTRIRHTLVECKRTALSDIHVEPHWKECKGSVSSNRLDAILALAFHTSRSSMLSHITNGEVFINSRMVVSASHSLNEGDVVSARGFGKFIFDGVLSGTKKGRWMIALRIFD